MLFSKRIEIADGFEKWADEHKARKDFVAFLSYLEIKGYLKDEQPATAPAATGKTCSSCRYDINNANYDYHCIKCKNRSEYSPIVTSIK